MMSHLILRLVKYDMQMIWPSEALSHTMRDTRLPENLNWETMLLPFEAMTVMVPAGVLSSPDGDVHFISYARTRTNEETAIHWLIRFSDRVEYGVVYENRIIPMYHSHDDDQDALKVTPERLGYLERALHYLLNILFSLTLTDKRPDFSVSEPRVVGQRKIGGKVVEQYWSPRVFVSTIGPRPWPTRL
jgi:hypothetical protein